YLKNSVDIALSNSSYEHQDNCLRVIAKKNVHSPTPADDVRKELSNQLERSSLNINHVNKYGPPTSGQFLRFETISPFVFRILKDCLNSDWHGIENEI